MRYPGLSTLALTLSLTAGVAAADDGTRDGAPVFEEVPLVLRLTLLSSGEVQLEDGSRWKPADLKDGLLRERNRLRRFSGVTPDLEFLAAGEARHRDLCHLRLTCSRVFGPSKQTVLRIK
jgi:hypothetical protein